LTLAPPGASGLDPARKGSLVVLSSGNNVATFGATQQMVLGAIGINNGSGKFYFEVTFTSGTSSGNAAIGVAPATEPLTGKQLGYDDAVTGSIGMFQSSGSIYRDGSSSAVGSGSGFATAGHVVCVAVDTTARLIWFRRGSGIWNNNAANNPATGVGGISNSGSGTIYPAIGTDKVSAWTANFGTSAFNQTAPSGFASWNTGASAIVSMQPSDVILSGMNNNDLFQYNGSNWANVPVATVMAAYAPLASPLFTGPVKFPVYTLTTLPSASANNQCYITVSNATGGPALCISNGTNWINVRTNATVE
jgi:hypothetical protein